MSLIKTIANGDLGTSAGQKVLQALVDQANKANSANVVGRLRLKGNRAGLLGHSMAAQALERQLNGSADTRRLMRTLFAFALSSLSRGRLVFPESLAVAVSGWTSTQVLSTLLSADNAPMNAAAVGKTQMATLIAGGANVIFAQAYHNDPINGLSLATTKANHVALSQQAVDAGIPIVWLSNTPVGSTEFPVRRQAGATLRAATGFRDWLLNELPFLPGFEGRVLVVDLWPILQDRRTAATNGDILPAFTVDGVHKAAAGGIVEGRKILRDIEAILPTRRSCRSGIRGDDFNAADNPRGNLLKAAANIADAGTAISGTQGGVTLAGVKPTSWPNLNLSGTFQAGTNVTLTGSMVDLPGGGRAWRCAVQGTAGPSGGNFSIDPGGLLLSDLTSGDRVGMFGDFLIEQGGTGIANLGARIQAALPGGEFDVIAIGESDTGTRAMDVALASEAFSGSFNGDISHLVTKLETSITPAFYVRVPPNAVMNFAFLLWDPAVRTGCLA